MPDSTGAEPGHLTDTDIGTAHHAQWQAAELCYQWLSEWEDVEIRELMQLGRLREHLDAMARGIQAALAEVDQLGSDSPMQ